MGVKSGIAQVTFPTPTLEVSIVLIISRSPFSLQLGSSYISLLLTILYGIILRVHQMLEKVLKYTKNFFWEYCRFKYQKSFT
jgi:hypothetical protein